MLHSETQNIRHLLGEMTFARFLESHFEKQYFYLPCQHKKTFDNLLSLTALDTLLASVQIAKNSIRLVKNGTILPESNYVLTHETTEMVSNERVLDHFRDGATIIIEGIHRYIHQVNVLTKELQAAFHAPVMINCYITPQESYGFRKHFDSHCVFIVQIAGSKQWELYNEVAQELPTPAFFEGKTIENMGTPTDLTLSAGDVMYIPRGVYHAAKSQHSFSVHLTIGIYPLLVKELLSSWLETLNITDIDLRKSLVHVSDTAPVTCTLANIIRKVPDNLVKKMAADKIAREDLWPIQKNRLINLCHLDDITLLTLVKVKDGLQYDIVENGDTFVLQFNNKEITLPTNILASIDKLSGAMPVKACFTVYNNIARLALIKNLVSNGFLDLVNH